MRAIALAAAAAALTLGAAAPAAAPASAPVAPEVVVGAVRGEEFPQQAALFALDASGSLEPVETEVPDPIFPTWSPDGSLLAVSDVTLLHVIRPDGSLVGTLGGDPEFFPQYAWAPDSARIAHALNTADGPRLLIQGLTGAVLADITPRWLKRRDTITRVTWSPDGRWIGFYRECLDRRGFSSCAQYELVPAEDGRPVTLFEILVPHRDGLGDVDWAPDGEHLAVASGRSVRRSVGSAIVKVPNGARTRLNLTGVMDVAALEWSPSGDRLAGIAIFWSLGNPFRLVTWHPDGTHRRELAESVTAFDWASDESLLYAGSESRELWRVSVDGRHTELVATLPRGWRIQTIAVRPAPA